MSLPQFEVKIKAVHSRLLPVSSTSTTTYFSSKFYHCRSAKVGHPLVPFFEVPLHPSRYLYDLLPWQSKFSICINLIQRVAKIQSIRYDTIHSKSSLAEEIDKLAAMLFINAKRVMHELLLRGGPFKISED